MLRRAGSIPRPIIAILVAMPIVLILLAVGGYFAGPAALNAIYPTPENEMEFPHDFHVTSLSLECEFCHRAAETSRTATVPAVEQCMFCHKAVGTTKESLAPLRAAWARRMVRVL